MGRIAFIDFGLARLGVALSDENQIIASALPTVRAKATTQETIKALIDVFEPYHLEQVIIGLPLHLSGRKGFLAHEVEDFSAALKPFLSCPVILWDERLSTVQAERVLREGNLSRKKRTKVIDGVSAVLCLQNYLDFHASSKGLPSPL